MNVSAVCATNQNPKTVSMRPKETKRSNAMVATSGGVEWSWQMRRRESALPASAVVHDILTEKHRTKKAHRQCCRDKIHQRNGSKTFSVGRYSRVTNFGCENSGQCEKQLQPSWITHLLGRVLDVDRTDKPVMSVFSRLLEVRHGKLPRQ